MMRKQLYIEEDLNDGLRMLAARTGLSEAEHVRAALRIYLREAQRSAIPGPSPLLDLIGLVDDQGGPTDVAAHHDDYLYPPHRSA